MKTMQAYLVLFIFLLFLVHCITHIKQISKIITHFHCLLITILTTSKIIYLVQTMKKEIHPCLPTGKTFFQANLAEHGNLLSRLNTM